MKQLAKAKALSLLYEFPGCPVAQELGKWVLRCTVGVQPRWDLADQRWTMRGIDIKEDQIHERAVVMASRVVVARKFGVSVAQQEGLEEWIRGQQVLCQIPGHYTPGPVCWRDNFRRNVITSELGEKYYH